jgi:hypothetical protein
VRKPAVSRIMPVSRVFLAGITQSDYQFHFSRLI